MSDESIEERRLQLDIAKFEHQKALDAAVERPNFFNRNLGVIVTGLLTLAGLGFSWFQFQANARQKQIEDAATAAEFDRKVADMVLTIENSNAEPERRVHALVILTAAMPGDIMKRLLPIWASSATSATDISGLIAVVQVSSLSDDEKAELIAKLNTATKQAVVQVASNVSAPSTTAATAKSVSGESATATSTAVTSTTGASRTAHSLTVYVQYRSKDDLTLIDQLIAELRAQGYRVAGRQFVTQSTNGDVRMYQTADSAAATDLVDAVNVWFRANQVSPELAPKPLDLSASFPNLPQGIVELWLPDLTQAR